jgi:cell division protein FtsW
VLVAVVVTLIGLGLVMIFSASFADSNVGYGRPTYYFLRQLQWLVVSTVVMVAIALVDFRVLKRFSLLIMAVTVILLLAVLVFGKENLGSKRHLFGTSVQPSEVAKLTIIIYIAYWLSSKGRRLKEVSYGLVPFAVLLGLVALLVVMQPDFDTTGLIIITALIMFFVAGADVKQLAIFGLIATVTFVFAVMQIDYAAKRIQEYLSFLENPLNGSAQMMAGLKALAQGGLFGEGLGDGRNVVYLPFTDSIFAVVGEELGLVGTLGVILLFLAFAYRGLRIALRSQDAFGLILGCGITAWIAIQAFVNIAVNTATIPVGGLTLPFISYGGSSLLATMAAVGVLLSISRYGARETAGVPSERAGAASDGAFNATLGLGWRNWRSRLSHPGRSRRAKPAQPAGQRVGGISTSSRSTGYNVNTISAERIDGLNRRITRAKRTIARRTGASKRRPGSASAGVKRVPRRR